MIKISFKKTLFYLAAVIIIFAGQFLLNNGQLMGKQPLLNQHLINGDPVDKYLNKTPTIIYFWATWCGVCKMMQSPVDAVLQDYNGVTVAVKSADDSTVNKYLHEKQLNWNVLNDPLGNVAQQFKARGVPAVFFLNERGEIKLTTSGYVSEVGLRFRLWLVKYL